MGRELPTKYVALSVLLLQLVAAYLLRFTSPFHWSFILVAYINDPQSRVQRHQREQSLGRYRQLTYRHIVRNYIQGMSAHCDLLFYTSGGYHRAII
jgi:hypothetical protein